MRTREPVTRAQEAIGRGDWTTAHELLRALDEGPGLDPDGLHALAEAAYGLGDLEGAIDGFERAHTAHLDAGDPMGAAASAVSVAMYLMMDTGLMAPVRGWLRRAHRLLEDVGGETPPHAWLAVVQAYERLMSGDIDGLEVHAARAIDIGTRHGVHSAATMGRIATARVRIFRGEVQEGLDLLDEAAVGVAAGELDPLATGMAYCELICAMQGLAQYDRAAEWTEAMERWRHGTAFGGINGRCRVHRAELLRLRGSCAEAEEEALHACQELRPWMRREFGWPLTELGTIRLRRGDLAGAEEAFLAAHEHAWDAQPGLALLRLAQGDPQAALASIADALAHPLEIPSKERPPNTELRRAPLLEAQVRIAVAADDLDTARHAADELLAISSRFHSQGLQAMATTACGCVTLASGAIDEAVDQLGEAVRAWSLVTAPFETAMARRWLAAAHRAAGNRERARLEFRAAAATFERIGAERDLADTHRMADGTPADTLVPPAVSNSRTAVFRRDGDTWTLALDGRQVLLQDLKGLRYLARLLAEPAREFHALDLAAVESGHLPPPSSTKEAAGDLQHPGDSIGPLLDEQARRAYRRRLQEIEEDIDEAERHGDGERATQARLEREFLVRELERAVGLGGRVRTAGSTSERARTSVTRSIRYAIARIAEHHEALAEHLGHAIRTGTYCAYDPDPRAPVAWET